MAPQFEVSFASWDSSAYTIKEQAYSPMEFEQTASSVARAKASHRQGTIWCPWFTHSTDHLACPCVNAYAAFHAFARVQ